MSDLRETIQAVLAAFGKEAPDGITQTADDGSVCVKWYFKDGSRMFLDLSDDDDACVRLYWNDDRGTSRQFKFTAAVTVW